MLRHYDETGLLKPAKTDSLTNYRLYSTEQIPLLNKIVFLRDLGFSVAEIAVALEQWSDESVAKSLEQKRLDIEDSIRIKQEKILKIEQAQKDIQMDKMSLHCNVSIKAIPSYQVFSLRRTVQDYYAEGQLWKELSDYAKRNSIPISNDTFTIYHDMDYRESNVDIEVCAPVTQMGKDMDGFVFRVTEPVSIMASLMVHGPFEIIASAYLAFAHWLDEHNQFAMCGQSRQIVHRGPWNEDNPNRFLTEIQIPLKGV